MEINSVKLSNRYCNCIGECCKTIYHSPVNTMGDNIERPTSSWRWMVLLSRSLSTSICLGTFKSLGVFIPYFVDGFSTTTAVAGFVSSSLIGFGFLSTGKYTYIYYTVHNGQRFHFKVDRYFGMTHVQ